MLRWRAGDGDEKEEKDDDEVEVEGSHPARRCRGRAAAPAVACKIAAMSARSRIGLATRAYVLCGRAG